MICTECSYTPIKSLYIQYQVDCIKLVLCPRCGKVADKYIEYDNVILFIDTLLLKKPAYMHLAYNNVESHLLGCAESDDSSSPSPFRQYRHMYRWFVMFTLFHVYLTWAYEEKQPFHPPIISCVITQAPHVQYLVSVFQLVLEQAAIHLTLQLGLRWVLHWGNSPNQNLPPHLQSGYYSTVLSKTIMVSQSIKLFPILMLIWPYDNTTILAPLINFIGFVNTIEALKIITGYRYYLIFSIMLLALLMQSTVAALVLGTYASIATNSSLLYLLKQELAYDLALLSDFCIHVMELVQSMLL